MLKVPLAKFLAFVHLIIVPSTSRRTDVQVFSFRRRLMILKGSMSLTGCRNWNLFRKREGISLGVHISSKLYLWSLTTQIQGLILEEKIKDEEKMRT